MISVILLAGGKGRRMGLATPKQFLLLKDKPVLLHSYDVLVSLPAISEVIVVADEEAHSLFSPPFPLFAPPGERRQDSVFSGFNKVSSSCEWVIVHDAARPLITAMQVQNLIEAGKKWGAATLAHPVTSTIKRATGAGLVDKTLNRASLYDIQTPQILSVDLLKRGKAWVEQHGIEVTDDVSLAEHLGEPVKIVPSDSRNIKITTQKDLALAHTLLEDYAQV